LSKNPSTETHFTIVIAAKGSLLASTLNCFRCQKPLKLISSFNKIEETPVLHSFQSAKPCSCGSNNLYFSVRSVEDGLLLEPHLTNLLNLLLIDPELTKGKAYPASH